MGTRSGRFGIGLESVWVFEEESITNYQHCFNMGSNLIDSRSVWVDLVSFWGGCGIGLGQLGIDVVRFGIDVARFGIGLG